MQPLDLSLEEGDGFNTAVDRVSYSGLAFVGQRVHGVLSLVRRELVQELGHVAGAEDLVANFCGSSGGKYGAKMHPGMHFLLKNLQAAHGEL